MESGILFGAPTLFQRVHTASRTGRVPAPDYQPAPGQPILGPGIAHAHNIPEAQKDLRNARFYLNYAYWANYKSTQNHYVRYALSYLKAARREIKRA